MHGFYKVLSPLYKFINILMTYKSLLVNCHKFNSIL
jgi:hypothetical protein